MDKIWIGLADDLTPAGVIGLPYHASRVPFASGIPGAKEIAGTNIYKDMLDSLLLKKNKENIPVKRKSQAIRWGALNAGVLAGLIYLNYKGLSIFSSLSGHLF